MELNEVVLAIQTGAFDNNLRHISEAIKQRREMSAHKLIMSLRLGTRVIVKIDGSQIHGVVRKIKLKKAVVDFDEPFQGWHHNVLVPASMMELEL